MTREGNRVVLTTEARTIEAGHVKLFNRAIGAPELGWEDLRPGDSLFAGLRGRGDRIETIVEGNPR